MQGSGFGDIFNIKTFGESHGKALGVIVDGVPAGIPLSEEDINVFMERRRPGSTSFGTKRNEKDRAEIFSGVFEGKTTGTPIMIMFFNEDQNSKDYSNIKDIIRPGHGDYTYHEKYGIRDYRGGGRASARETIGRVAAGAIAIKALNMLGVSFVTYTESIGSVIARDIDESYINKNELYMPDPKATEEAIALVNEARSNMDSIGGVAKCIVRGVLPGMGDPVFDKLDAKLAGALMSIGAVKAVEIGDGVLASGALGSENNDAFALESGKVVKKTNHSGGILGGISDGSEIILKAHFKPTPSIAKEQDSVDVKEFNNKRISIHGRHDPIVVPRALVVVEAMAGIVLFDAYLKNMSARMDKIKDFYGVD